MSRRSSPLTPASDPQPPENWRYEAAVAEVESIISRIESGELALEDVFEQFAQAVESLGQCEAFLTERQAQIGLLIETLDD